MPNWKILISDTLADYGKDLMREVAEVTDKPSISAEDLVNEISEYHALVVRGRTKVTEAVFDAGENLMIVGRAGVGVDNIDLAAAQANGVTVVNSPTATTIAVAEHTLALMLSLVRNISRSDASMKTGGWDKKALRGSELGGKTLGIIGMGRIGRRVANLANAFGMTVIGCDPLIDEESIQDRGAEPVPLTDIYSRSDMITIHVPLTQVTRGMVNGEAFSRMKRGVYIICTARGGIIDETALLARLESGQVAGAALDVFAKEPPGLTALVSHPNVIATPHIGAQTKEAQERAAIHIAEEIISSLEGGPLRWKVV